MISLPAFEGTCAPSLAEEAQRERARHAHAEYCGYQEGAGPFPGFHLWTLSHTLSPKLVEGSTITQETLDAFLFA